MDGASSNYMGWGGQWALWKPQFMRPTESYSEGFWEEEAAYAASSDKNIVSPLEGNQIFGDANKLLKVGLAGDADEAIEKLKSDSESANFDAVLEEFQKQIDEFLAAKN